MRKDLQKLTQRCCLQYLNSGYCHQSKFYFTITTFHGMFLLFVTTLLFVVDGYEPGNVLDLVLRQVHVITRHGSRFPYLKEEHFRSNDTDDTMNRTIHVATPGTLTSTGERQMYDLGIWLKGRYNDDLDGQFNKYKPYQIRVESSDDIAASVSAMSLVAGLYDAKSRDPFDENTMMDVIDEENELGGVDKITTLIMRQNIPIYTIPAVHDTTLTAYDKCDTLTQYHKELYKSPEWKQLEDSFQHILTPLATVPEFKGYANDKDYIPLEELYNLYELVEVANIECVRTAIRNSTDGTTRDTMKKACEELGYNFTDVLDAFRVLQGEQGFAEFLELTHRAEIMKYGKRDTTAPFVGGNILQQILQNMIQYDRYELNNTNFYLYSGTYQTLYGILGTLDDTVPIEFEEIPSFASAIIIEMYETVEEPSPGENSKYIKLHYRMPNTADSIVKEDLPWGDVCLANDSNGAQMISICPLRAFYTYLRETVETKEWCSKCNNSVSYPCQQKIVEQCLTSEHGSSATNNKAGEIETLGTNDTYTQSNSTSTNDNGNILMLLLGIPIGILIGYIPLWILWYIQRKKRVKELLNEVNHESSNSLSCKDLALDESGTITFKDYEEGDHRRVL